MISRKSTYAESHGNTLRFETFVVGDCGCKAYMQHTCERCNFGNQRDYIVRSICSGISPSECWRFSGLRYIEETTDSSTSDVAVRMTLWMDDV